MRQSRWYKAPYMELCSILYCMNKKRVSPPANMLKIQRFLFSTLRITDTALCKHPHQTNIQQLPLFKPSRFYQHACISLFIRHTVILYPQQSTVFQSHLAQHKQGARRLWTSLILLCSNSILRQSHATLIGVTGVRLSLPSPGASRFHNTFGQTAFISQL